MVDDSIYLTIFSEIQTTGLNLMMLNYKCVDYGVISISGGGRGNGRWHNDSIKLTRMPKMLELHHISMCGCVSYFQNPGFDFSHAKLSKSYDRLPGWSVDATKKGEDEAEKDT
jgi:hypothetical protein